MGLTAWFLHHTDRPQSFGILFGVSLVLAGLSLFYLKKIPDAPTPSARKEGAEPVPWRAMISHRPFLRLITFHGIMMLALAGGGLIFIPFARDQLGCTDSKFMILHLIWGSVFVLASLRAGRMLDRVGSRPVLVLAAMTLGVHWLGWGAVAAHLLPFSWGVIFFQQATAGVGLAFYNSAQMRLLMATVPAMGRSHFFALFSVVASLVAGLAPLGWGLLTDTMSRWHLGTEIQVNGFVLLYGSFTLILFPAMVALRRVEEPRASTTEELLRELILETPWRSITRWWNRRPFA